LYTSPGLINSFLGIIEKLLAGVIDLEGDGLGLNISGFLKGLGLLIGGIFSFGGIGFFIFGILLLGGIALNLELNSL
jgi:hypothetical protein